jgi:hypothetical protein
LLQQLTQALILAQPFLYCVTSLEREVYDLSATLELKVLEVPKTDPEPMPLIGGSSYLLGSNLPDVLAVGVSEQERHDDERKTSYLSCLALAGSPPSLVLPLTREGHG